MSFYEDAPTEIFIIPKNSQNKRLAKIFISFVGRPEVQAKFSENLGFVPANKNARLGERYFIKEGAKILQEAKGLAQFYDRDTKTQMARDAIPIFFSFIKTGNVEAAVEALERARQHAFQ